MCLSLVFLRKTKACQSINVRVLLYFREKTSEHLKITQLSHHETGIKRCYFSWRNSAGLEIPSTIFL